MTKNKFYLLLIGGLLITNLMLVGFMITKKGDHPRHHGPRDLVINKLQFDDSQIAKYEKLILGHRTGVESRQKRINSIKQQLYRNLIEEADDKDSLVNEIARIQSEIEMLHFNHFKDIQNICTPDQMPNFEELSLELAKIFSRKPPKRH